MTVKTVFCLMLLTALLVGCGKREEPEDVVAESLEAESAQGVANDPAILAREVWEAMMATNVEKVVALSLDEGLAADGKMSDRLRTNRYRLVIAEAAETFSGATLASAETIKLRTHQARVALTLTRPTGETEEVDLRFEKTPAGLWRLNLFAEKDF